MQIRRSKKLVWTIINLSMTFIFVLSVATTVVGKEESKKSNTESSEIIPYSESIFRQKILNYKADSSSINFNFDNHIREMQWINESERFIIHRINIKVDKLDLSNKIRNQKKKSIPPSNVK
jgi:hypothetical protein